MNQLAQLVFVEAEGVRRIESAQTAAAQRAPALFIQRESIAKRRAALDAEIFSIQRLGFGQTGAAYRDAGNFLKRLRADPAVVGENQRKESAGELLNKRRGEVQRGGVDWAATAEDSPPTPKTIVYTMRIFLTRSRGPASARGGATVKRRYNGSEARS